MTVEELIAMLEEMPQDALVFIDPGTEKPWPDPAYGVNSVYAANGEVFIY